MSGDAPPFSPRGSAAGERLVDVVTAAQLACLLEACAPKPGNVSPGRHFGDTRFEDFLASAAALGGPLSNSGAQALGATIRQAVEATTRWTRRNTNLGIVLLLTPLARAARACAGGTGGGAAPPGLAAPPVGAVARSALRDSVQRVLEATSVEDARDVYAAIRLVAPGGLGTSESQDVAADPTLPLVEVMRIASARDDIAREFATGFAVTFEDGAPALDRARGDGLTWDDAIVETFLTLLARRPDSHIARRAGLDAAQSVSRRAADALQQGGVRTETGRHTIEAMDRALRDPRNAANPGTTADLTAAAIYVVLLTGGWWRA